MCLLVLHTVLYMEIRPALQIQWPFNVHHWLILDSGKIGVSFLYLLPKWCFALGSDFTRLACYLEIHPQILFSVSWEFFFSFMRLFSFMRICCYSFPTDLLKEYNLEANVTHFLPVHRMFFFSRGDINIWYFCGKESVLIDSFSHPPASSLIPEVT